MRTQIAAANWKMNLNLNEAKDLLEKFKQKNIVPADNQLVILGVPFPYLLPAVEVIGKEKGFAVAAQNCYDKASGAYTGETSAGMIASCGAEYVILGHSERREYFKEDFEMLAAKVDIVMKNGLKPIFCCGEPLDIREAGTQNDYVAHQLEKSLFHLDGNALKNFIVAYEPIWAIGTGKTATAAQAQEMHHHIREVFAKKYGASVAASISILYGGSVKGANASEIFSEPDVDGGLVGGAALNADEFETIIRSLKK